MASRANTGSRRPSGSQMGTPTFDSGRIEPYKNQAPHLKVVKTEIDARGDAVQLIRAMPDDIIPAKDVPNSQEIVKKLFNQYDYKKAVVRGDKKDVDIVRSAFPKLANNLISSYEGSSIIADSAQDLIGDKYLEAQIRQINEQNKKTSILDKWGHLLYEGEDEETYRSATEVPVLDLNGVQPTQSRTFSINSNRNQYHH